jgi:pimeloyl-ACP methyl ester carboxylesterase
VRESALRLGPGALIGVVSEPDLPDPARPAVLLLNAGMVHRVGPSRLSVRLARALCASGFRVARFDHGGLGDSAPRAEPGTWLEGAAQETRAVMDALAERHGTQSFLLAGLCAGAATAFRAAVQDPRVAGICLLNAQGLDGSPRWNAHVKNRGWARNYWTRSLRNPDSWRRALRGRVGYARLAGVLYRSAAQRLFPPRDVAAIGDQLSGELAGLLARRVRVLFVFAGDEHSRDYFDAVAGGRRAQLEASGCLRTAAVARSDHTFTLLADQRELVPLVERWALGGEPPR